MLLALSGMLLVLRGMVLVLRDRVLLVRAAAATGKPRVTPSAVGWLAADTGACADWEGMQKFCGRLTKLVTCEEVRNACEEGIAV